MKRIAILGAGTGGLIIANLLARKLRHEIAKGNVEVSLFDISKIYIFEAGLPLYVVGAFKEESLTYNKINLIDPVVKFYHGEHGHVVKIDLKNRQFATAKGGVYNYDYLVLALGVSYDPSLVKGLLDDYNTYYSYDKAKELRSILAGFKGGVVVHLISSLEVPIKCPIAPGKFSLLLDSYLRNVKLLRNYKIIVATPTDHLHAQPEVNKVLEERFKDLGIEFIYNFEVDEVDSKNKIVKSTKGDTLKYDFLITVPPHRGPKVVHESGIGDPLGLVPVDRHTLTYRKGREQYDEVYAVGDVTNLGVAKAGSVAHYEALVVAHNIASEVLGFSDKWNFFGETICPFLEAIYSPASKGRGWMPWWTYGMLGRPFVGNRWAWLLLRMYYHTIPLTLRGLI
ncbi:MULTISPECIES: NAD(P)/FAD-dependent oxidoreductase [Pyrobaculum]|uniref:FAD-dependent pyridine nucleotide-disulfide oxidoreductase n=1 Tax=Pyrobaculum arsenaticum (strain DSM 13514 / JCM 11321 / PZ6) TaxID=340102 RepID=A4WJC6_PYRAR|nr:FAD/NAD(P)-binding oxidoreductase [Pyrobaculum arsenaticum]ABP50493.1 FAD-dependent pyridine nucleotide-disulfide oxidoreductase [Pyrobaculum arsenaticum DSM 13514]